MLFLSDVVPMGINRRHYFQRNLSIYTKYVSCMDTCSSWYQTDVIQYLYSHCDPLIGTCSKANSNSALYATYKSGLLKPALRGCK